MWYIDFNYNSTVFVYYCEDDSKIHWDSYSTNLWKQNLGWIKIEIKDKKVITKIEDNLDISNNTNTIENNNSIKQNNNWNNYSIWWWDKFEIENSTINKLDWNVFWIIK